MMNLAMFIKTHETEIIKEWQDFAQTCLPASEDMDRKALQDHIRALLHFIVNDIDSPQTEAERDQKSKGHAPKAEGKEDSAATSHGGNRFKSGFDLLQLYAEFRALRASVLKLWAKEWTKSNRDFQSPADIIPDLMRFNESIDQMFSESLERYLSEEDSEVKHEPHVGADALYHHGVRH